MATSKKPASNGAKPTTKAKRGQSSIFDKEINDTALEAMLEAMGDNADPRSSEQRSKYVVAKNGVNAAIANMKGVKDGDVIRVGRFLIPIVHRAGGGFKVGTWEKRIAGKIQAAPK